MLRRHPEISLACGDTYPNKWFVKYAKGIDGENTADKQTLARLEWLRLILALRYYSRADTFCLSP